MTWIFKLARRMASSRTKTFLPIAAVVISLTACGSDVTGTETQVEAPAAPVAGMMTVQLDTPANDDGAVQFQITGPAIDSVRALGYQGYASTVNTSAQLIVTGQVHDGLVARVYIKDMSRANEYRVAIVAAAARSTYTLQNLQGYSATLNR